MEKAHKFQTLERGATLSDRVTSSIMDMIRRAELRPGDRLPSERDLGERFGVSRTVVREALRSLAAKGVLDVRSGSGAVVARVDAARAGEALRLFVQSSSGIEGQGGIDYDQIDDVREMLECRVARIAAELADPSSLKLLQARHEEMARHLADPEAASRCDVAFHREIAVATRNPLYLIMLDSIAPVLLEIRLKTLSVPTRPSLALEAHAHILDCIEVGDAAAAEQAMLAHLTESRAIWRSTN